MLSTTFQKRSAFFYFLILIVLCSASSADAIQESSASWENAPNPVIIRHAEDWATLTGAPLPARTPPPPPAIGARRDFITLLGDMLPFTLAYQSQWADFWFEAGVSVDEDALQQAAATFDTVIYPFLLDVYPSERETPRRVALLHLNNLGYGAAGAFLMEDLCSRALCPLSNEIDALYLGLNQAAFNSPAYWRTLAHELQHLLHAHTDGNERRWLNEGISQWVEAALFAEDFFPAYTLTAYYRTPEIPIEDWSVLDPAPNYGAGYLFVRYLVARFGAQVIRDLIHTPQDGLAGVDAVLPLPLDEVFMDWLIHNQIAYPLDNRIPYPPIQVGVEGFTYRDSLPPYAARYYALPGNVTYEIGFEGAIHTPLAPIDMPENGLWWSGNAESSAALLTAEVIPDAESRLSFEVWYSIAGGDGLGVFISTDGGNTWEALPIAEIDNPETRVTFPHFGGASEDWQTHQIDLSGYVGQALHLRFIYLTDSLDTGTGVLLANLRVSNQPALSWQAQGFLETSGIMPQNWGVRVIRWTNPPEVVILPVDAHNRASGEVRLPPEGGLLVIGSMSPFTRQQAAYELRVNRLNENPGEDHP